MEAVVLHRVGFLEHFCPKQGKDFKPLAAPLYPNMGQVSPPPRENTITILKKINKSPNFVLGTHILSFWARKLFPKKTSLELQAHEQTCTRCYDILSVVFSFFFFLIWIL